MKDGKIDHEAACVRCRHFAVCKHVDHTKALIKELPRDTGAELRHELACRMAARRGEEPPEPDFLPAPVLYTAVANVCAAYLPGEHKAGKSLWPEDLEEMARKATRRTSARTKP